MDIRVVFESDVHAGRPVVDAVIVADYGFGLDNESPFDRLCTDAK